MTYAMRIQDERRAGINEGRQEGIEEIRKNMRAAGFSDEIIDKVTMIQ